MSRSFFRTYGFLSAMLLAIVLGCVLGALWPGATCLAPLGTIFINLMFCIVVPLVFCSLSSSIACMKSPKRAGKIMGTTLLVFIVTGLIAAVIMLFAMRLYPPVLEPWADAAAGEVDEQASVAQLLVNFFTVEDFAALLSRRAMLPLIVFSILIGFGVNLSGGADCLTAKVLQDMTNCLLKVVSLISYYAPVAFFGFFASLVATYGAQITAAYGRAMLVYYPLCFVYALVAFPLYAYLGGGKEGVRVMRRHILRPAVTALGTCSSVATIPTNLEAAEDSGVPRDISDLVLPLGATMHMDGSCFSCVLKIAFLFGVFGIPFEAHRQNSACRRVQLGRDERHPRRRVHRRVHHLYALLPRADGHCLPHRRDDRQPCRPTRDDDQFRWRLRRVVPCCTLHRGKRLA